MKIIHIYLLFLLISSYRGVTQEKKSFLVSPKMAFGQGGNDFQSGATCVQFDLMAHKGIHVFNAITESTSNISNYTHSNFYFSKYKSIDFCFLYGLQLDKQYFSTQISSGIGLISTLYHQDIDCLYSQANSPNYETCFISKNYTKPSLPLLVNITGKYKRYGIFAQALFHFTFPRIDYRYTFGLRIDLYSR